MGAVVVEKRLQQLEEQLVLEEIVILEPVISGILVGLVVAQNIIAVNAPSAGDPLMEFFINDALLGKLIIDVVLSRDLKLSVSALALIIVMLLVAVTMPATTSDRGVGKSLHLYVRVLWIHLVDGERGLSEPSSEGMLWCSYFLL